MSARKARGEVTRSRDSDLIAYAAAAVGDEDEPQLLVVAADERRPRVAEGFADIAIFGRAQRRDLVRSWSLNC